MIDIHNKVFDTVYTAVTTSYPSADVTTGYDAKNAVFPCVVVEEVENSPYQSANTDGCAENYTRVAFEVSVYTNTENVAKSDGRNIIKIIDTALQGLKFRRIRTNRPINIDRTVFRQYGRWEVIVGKPIEVGSNTVYQMYRR